MGGKVIVESVEGEGSIFAMTFKVMSILELKEETPYNLHECEKKCSKIDAICRNSVS